jgi:hypothetical protein
MALGVQAILTRYGSPTVKRGTKVVRATDVEKLNGTERVQYTLTASWFGALNQATRPALAKKIQTLIEGSADVRPGNVLQLVMKKRK